MPNKAELEKWLDQASKLIRAARTREDALAVYRSKELSIAHWHPAVAKGMLKRLAEAGKARFR